MFSFLTPVSLWLGALLAVPLVIHFLGRQRLRKVPFPSLLLLEEKFARSMHRHRLKNLLLLIIRTLLILCLLLALANPAMESRSSRAAAAGTGSAAALIHNGAFGLLPSDAAGAAAEAGKPSGAARAGADGALGFQRARLRGLDSAMSAKVQAVPLIADGAGLAEAAERFGDYGEAAERLLGALDAQAAASEVYLPVFAWADLEPARDILVQALKDRPGLQVVFWDHGQAGSRISAFAGIRSVPSAQAPTVSLRALLNPAALELRGPKVRAWLEGRIFQDAAADQGLAEITVPLSDGPRTEGRLSLDGGEGSAGGLSNRGLGGLGAANRRFTDRDFAIRDWYFCFPNPGRLTLAHAGSSMASLPSLGRENYFRRIVHVGAAKDLPWNQNLRLIYLSNERNTDAAAYGRIVEFVKRGGRLIVGVGRETDVPLLNRFLLQPLRMGRLGVVQGAPAAPGGGQATGGRAEIDPQALARLGGVPANPGPLGLVRKRFIFVPDSGTAILAREGGEPVLAERDFHQGKVLLWTTDLDDLEWSDLGVAPLVPLLHRAFQEGAGGLTANRTVDSDSLLTLDMPDPGVRPEVRDPDGRPFTRLRAEGGRLRMGPFDKLGIHRAVLGTDTVAFAVNLAARGPESWLAEDDWEQWNADRREEVMKAFEPFRGRVVVADADAGQGQRATVRPLWKAFFLAAILLLFLEGLVASAFSLGRRPGP